MEVTFEVNTNDLEKNLKVYPLRVRKAIAEGLDHASRSFLKHFAQERLQGPPGIEAHPSGIFHRFKRLTTVNGEEINIHASKKAAVSAIAKSSDDIYELNVEVFSNSDVAAIHEKGGTIHAGKPMPIPLNEEARSMARQGMSLKDLAPVKINGKLFLGRKVLFGKMRLLFILKKSINVKARLGFYKTYDSLEGRREQIYNEALAQAFSKM
jgi:hypothetical protein